MTYKELKDFCEKNNVRYEVHPILSEPTDIPVYENGKITWKEHRTHLGFTFGMNNIAGRKGKSEWQWVWYDTLLCPETLEDDTKMFFRQRYSMVNGKSYKSWREDLAVRRIMERRSK